MQVVVVVVDDDDESALEEGQNEDRYNMRALQHCTPDSLRYRHLKQIIQSENDLWEEMQKRRQSHYKLRKESLLDRFVSKEVADLLPQDPSEPYPSPILKDLVVIKRAEDRGATEVRRKQAKEAFENSWVERTERLLHECTVRQDKNHHRNSGTTNCATALQERRRTLGTVPSTKCPQSEDAIRCASRTADRI